MISSSRPDNPTPDQNDSQMVSAASVKTNQHKTDQPVANPSPSQRLILMIGSPRSGTTWLAKILDTYAGVLYLHEPLHKLRYGPINHLIDAVRAGRDLGDEEQVGFVRQLARMHRACVRPPFFPKRYHSVPPAMLKAAWLAAGWFRGGEGLFRKLFSAERTRNCDLLVKEVDFQSRCASLVEAFRPDRVLVVVRHPCAVVCSRLNGLRLGVISGHDRDAWLARHHERAEALGYSADRVSSMSLWGLYALDWLLQNLEYQRIVQDRPGSQTVVFEQFCQRPEAAAVELFQSLGWEPTPATGQFIRTSGGGSAVRALSGLVSRRRWYYDLHRNPEEAANNWKALMSQEQVDEVLEVTRSFPGMSWWAPHEKPLAGHA
jgi:hypothetical protein